MTILSRRVAMFGRGVVSSSRGVAMLSSGLVTLSHGVAFIIRGVVTFSRGVVSSLVVEWSFLVFSDVTLSQF